MSQEDVSLQVTTLRQELEDFLKDDDDMAKMCLSRKRDQATQWAAANAQGSSPSVLLPQIPPHQRICMSVAATEARSLSRALAHPQPSAVL